MEKKYLPVAGEFGQCSRAALNSDGNSPLAYCAGYSRVMDGRTVTNFCKGCGRCDQ